MINAPIQLNPLAWQFVDGSIAVMTAARYKKLPLPTDTSP